MFANLKDIKPSACQACDEWIGCLAALALGPYRPFVKLFRENLFNRKTLATALARAFEVSDEQRAAAAYWANEAQAGFGGRNESQLEQPFNQYVLQRILGYSEESAGGAGTMRAKQAIGAGTVDVALGQFAGNEVRVAAPVELKGPKTDLDRIMPGRAKTPVQQAWEYAMDAAGARWVLVSNMRHLRVYAFGHGTAAYEEFDLAALDDPDELRRLILLCHSVNLLGGATADLLTRSASEDRDITNQLYRDYRTLRHTLMQWIVDQRPDIEPETRIALVQKILDRLVFIAYAEDTVLLPDDRLKLAVEQDDPFFPRPKWDNVRALFKAIDTGNPRLGITGYNGGLFAPDALVDGLALPDHLVTDFLKLTRYDYKSEISVTILGHLFEQTIGDIEADLLAARGEDAPGPGKKKRDGIVYTPDFVTRFIVDYTLGRLVGEVRAELLNVHADGVDDDGCIRWRGAEKTYWAALIARLKAITVLDPACGSGHFLVAAFDYLAAATKEANDRLRELDPLAAEDRAAANAHIITRSLYGVDLNAESVEITRLSLWLKTAQPRQQLTTLDHNIRVGNSIVTDPAVHPRAFDWAAFSEIDACGGFDVVTGNPPYVRMELLKSIKPYLEANYAVVSDRADLYAYFFELGVRRLKPGGRLGYVSSSTFFRTGSGAPLREWLGASALLEAVIDFGDVQLFEGVTTYPAILTMRKRIAEQEASTDLRFLNLASIPADLGKAFEEESTPMPQARLLRGGWRFEGDRLAALRAKMAAGRQTLSEAYGSPLYGIKTGLNEAFVVSRSRRDALIAADAKSAVLLKPFFIGENLKRWHVESDDLWLIYTPKNTIAIDDYPAVRDHLSPFRVKLDARATKQNWWELQQAQAAYLPAFLGPKLIWPHFNDKPNFSFDATLSLSNDKSYILPGPPPWLAAALNAKAIWQQLVHLAPAVQRGYREARVQYVAKLIVPDPGEGAAALSALAGSAADAASALWRLKRSVHDRLGDLHPSAAKLFAFAAWPSLTFPQLRALLVKRCKTDIPVSERDQWERYLTDRRGEAVRLTALVAAAEAEIDDRVYRLFGLSREEISLIEETIG